MSDFILLHDGQITENQFKELSPEEQAAWLGRILYDLSNIADNLSNKLGEGS